MKTKKMMKRMDFDGARRAAADTLHQGQEVAERTVTRVLDRMIPSRRRRSRVRSTAAGLGAMAVAVPAGIWLGQRIRTARHHEAQPAGMQ